MRAVHAALEEKIFYVPSAQMVNDLLGELLDGDVLFCCTTVPG